MKKVMHATDPETGTEIRTVSLAYHTTTLTALASIAASIIVALWVKLYDQREIPAEVGARIGSALRAEITAMVAQKEATAIEQHRRLEDKIDGATKRIDKLEDWRDDMAGLGWRGGRPYPRGGS